jgi:ADP-ribosylglycohydrolase
MTGTGRDTKGIQRASRLSGAIWGVLVGDAAGVPYEFMAPSSIKSFVNGRGGGYHDVPPGTWSDDGALTLASLDSLLNAGFDPEDMARRFLAWRDRGNYTPDGRVFDIGTTTSAALARYAAGVRPATAAGGRTMHENGNGSLMRILPLALAAGGPRLSLVALVKRAHAASAVTHAHPRSQAACALYLVIARGLLAGTAPAPARYAAETTLRRIYVGWPEPDRSSYVDALAHLLSGEHTPGGGTAWDGFHSAWTALVGATDYAGVIERAVLTGGDTDTTAAIAGGLAGIVWGLEGIPPAWRAGLRGQGLVSGLVRRLIEADAR